MTLVLFILAFLLFALSALNVQSSRINLTAAGLAVWLLAQIVTIAWR